MYQEYFDLAYNYVQHQVTSNQFFSAAALSSVGLGIWYYLRGVPLRIWSRIHRYIFYSMTIEQDSKLFNYYSAWVNENYKQDLRRVEASLDNDELVLSHENDYTIFWYRYRRLRLAKSKQKLESPMNQETMFQRNYSISGYLAKGAILDLTEKVIKFGQDLEERKKEEKKDYIKIYSLERWGSFGNGIKDKLSPRKQFDKIYLDNKSLIIQDLDNFISQKELYEKLGVPFKRGFMFYGAPGNGKSSLAYAIAKYLNYDIYVVDLSMVKDGDFSSVIRNVDSNSVVVIEDLDAYYDGRKPAPDNKINFSAFINALSGILQKSNIVTVFTTNDIDKVDAAILRAGRCDKVIELKNPSKQLVEQYLKDIFDKEILLNTYKECLSFSAIQRIVLDNLENAEQIKTILENGDCTSIEDEKILESSLQTEQVSE